MSSRPSRGVAGRQLTPELLRGFEFNVGVDVEEIDRFRRISTDRERGALFVDEEIEYCLGYPDPAPRFAGTWCAKEAAVKALWPWQRLQPRQITIARDGDGPRILVAGESGGSLVAVRVSITHSRSVAMASVIAWGPSTGVDVAPHEGRRS